MRINKWNIKEKTIPKRIPISYDKKVDDFIFKEEEKKRRIKSIARGEHLIADNDCNFTD